MRVIQFIHPGNEFKFHKNKGFVYDSSDKRWIRIWNSDDKHYRKLIKCAGCYVNPNNPSKPVDADELYFWGEWESYSHFTQMNGAGIHEPFYGFPKGVQNTDPYVFGDDGFKYCICQQTGKLLDLNDGDIIVFGTNKNNYFCIDTIFVVDLSKTVLSSDIKKTCGKGFTSRYIDVTLSQLRQYLRLPYKPAPKGKKENKVYRSRTWSDNNHIFSFVPCCINYKPVKFQISWNDLNYKKYFGKNSQGRKITELHDSEIDMFWNWLLGEIMRQNFVLGISFAEPQTKHLNQSVISKTQQMVRDDLAKVMAKQITNRQELNIEISWVYNLIKGTV